MERPPALSTPLIEVWQIAQSPSAASCRPRSMVAAENTETFGLAIGAIERHGNIAVAIPMPPATRAAAVAKTPRRVWNGFDQRFEFAGAEAGEGSDSRCEVCSP